MRSVALVLIFLLSAFMAEGQKSRGKTTKKSTPVQTAPKKSTAGTKKADATPKTDPGHDQARVKDIITFLQFVMNTLGNSATPSRDKDVLITESYSKIFRDDKVQVEDDLDEAREVITNKDVVAYLKDVDFFFQDVKFEFTIDEITNSTLPGGELFYKVAMRRNITGTTADGKQVNNTRPRFVEINYDPDSQDLKIVSIYTNEFDETEALTNWWNSLSHGWKDIFRRKLNLQDSVNISQIKMITAIEDLDLSSNRFIQDLEPLSELISLKLLDVSSSAVTDLTPIRNLTELIELNLANTRIEDLTPLKYASKLQRLNINYTRVNNIAVVEKMTALQTLETEGTGILSFSALASLGQLVHLNLTSTQVTDMNDLKTLTGLQELLLTSTPVQDMSPLEGMVNLVTLNVDSTRVRDLSVMAHFKKLRALHANYTFIDDLAPLRQLPDLQKIYCDQTNVTRAMADAFMAERPDVLVIFDSKDLKSWWDTLEGEWQTFLITSAGIGSSPGREELARITNLDSINLAGNTRISDIEPLTKLQKLETVVISRTPVSDLSPLAGHRLIRYLDISETPVKDLTAIGKFTKLKVLRADGAAFETAEPIHGLKELSHFYADRTAIDNDAAIAFLKQNPQSLIVFKTETLNQWWSGLSPEWKEIFRSQMGKDTVAHRENLHRLTALQALSFRDTPVNDLSVLNEFIRLESLHFSGTAIGSIPVLPNLFSLKSLHASNGPIRTIESLGKFQMLEDLDISNTPVDELRPIGSLKNLKKLNCSGTQIRKLDPLESLEKLEFLDCSNSRVGDLDPVSGLALKTLKCYNTKVSGKEIEKFKERNRECNVVFYR